MCEHSHPEEVQVTLEDSPYIFGALPGAHAGLFVSDHHRVDAELNRRHLRRDPGSNRLLHEEKPDRASGQSTGVCSRVGADERGEIDELVQFIRFQVADPKKMLHFLSFAPSCNAPSIIAWRT